MSGPTVDPRCLQAEFLRPVAVAPLEGGGSPVVFAADTPQACDPHSVPPTEARAVVAASWKPLQVPSPASPFAFAQDGPRCPAGPFAGSTDSLWSWRTGRVGAVPFVSAEVSTPASACFAGCLVAGGVRKVPGFQCVWQSPPLIRRARLCSKHFLGVNT